MIIKLESTILIKAPEVRHDIPAIIKIDAESGEISIVAIDSKFAETLIQAIIREPIHLEFRKMY